VQKYMDDNSNDDVVIVGEETSPSRCSPFKDRTIVVKFRTRKSGIIRRTMKLVSLLCLLIFIY